MLYPDEIQGYPIKFLRLMEGLEDQIIRDTAKSLTKLQEVNETSLYRFELLNEMGLNGNRIQKKLAAEIEQMSDEVIGMYEEAARKAYSEDQRAFSAVYKLKDYEDNDLIQRIVSGIEKQTKGSFLNLSNTTGFIYNNKFLALSDYLRKMTDQVVFNVTTGAYTTEAMVRKAVDDLGDHGIQVLDFKRGVHRRIDGHIRTLIRTGLNQLSNEISKANIEDSGNCYVETSAHSGARPSHQVWQGQVFYWAEMDNSGDGNKDNYPDFVDSTGYGTGAGLGGWNCRHSFHNFYPGISRRAYSKKQLENIDPEPFEYKGKEYDAYDASQRQRQLERNIRASKRRIVGYDTIGDQEAFILESIKLNRLRENYEGFIRASKNTATRERFKISGYNRSIQSKAVWENRKVNENPILAKIINKNWSFGFKKKAIGTYNAFEKEGFIMGDHFIGRFLQRQESKGHVSLTIEDALAIINGRPNFSEDGYKSVYFSKKKQFACIKNDITGEFITFVRRKNKKKGWVESD